MKSTGVYRTLDAQGRIVFPAELIKTLKLKGKPLEFFIANNLIILRVYNPGCLICDNMTELKDYRCKKICKSCIEQLKIR